MKRKKTTYLTKEDLPQVKLPLSQMDFDRLWESWMDGDLLLSDFSDELSKDFRVFAEVKIEGQEQRLKDLGVWMPFG